MIEINRRANIVKLRSVNEKTARALQAIYA